MSKKITYINQDKNISNDYNIIIEDENGNKTLAKHDEKLDQLLKQEVLVENIKDEKQKILNKSNNIKDIISDRKKDIIESILIPTIFILFFKITFDLLTGDALFDIPIFGTEVVYSTFVATITTIVTVPEGIISAIYNKYRLNKAKDKQKRLEAQYEYLNEIEEKETTKLEEYNKNVNLEKNSIQLKTETITPKEELQKLKEELIYYYTLGYHTENNNSNIKENNEEFVKTKK